MKRRLVRLVILGKYNFNNIGLDSKQKGLKIDSGVILGFPFST